MMGGNKLKYSFFGKRCLMLHYFQMVSNVSLVIVFLSRYTITDRSVFYISGRQLHQYIKRPVKIILKKKTTIQHFDWCKWSSLSCKLNKKNIVNDFIVSVLYIIFNARLYDCLSTFPLFCTFSFLRHVRRELTSS